VDLPLSMEQVLRDRMRAYVGRASTEKSREHTPYFRWTFVSIVLVNTEKVIAKNSHK